MIEDQCVVKINNGVARLFDSKGRPISCWEYDDIIRALIEGKAAQLMRETSATISDLLNEVDEWVYPERRSDLFVSGPSVYFVRVDTRPRLVKIGRTTNMANRTKGLAYKEGVDEVSVLAFAKTTSHHKLERALHAVLHRNRVEGEWFEESAVMDFIETYGG
jgi:hypothetical protein